jgi:hypothetical protein
MFCHSRLIVLLALALVSCTRSPTADSDLSIADARADRVPEARVVLPWVNTFAGNACEPAPRYGSRLQAAISPRSLAMAANGPLYFASEHTIAVMDGDQILPIAGMVTSGTAPADGPASSATFAQIEGLVVAADGTIYVAELWLVRQIAQGYVTTLAGAYATQDHVDGPALQARFYQIHGIDLTSDGAIIIGEMHHLRRLQNGIVTTIAGSGKNAASPLVDGPALEATLFHVLALRSVGDAIIFAERQTLRSLSAGQVVTLGGGWGSELLCVDGPLATARFSMTIPAIAAHQGILYIADQDYNRIRKVENGVVTTLTSGKHGLRDGPLADAEFDLPTSLAVDPEGNLYVADLVNCRIRMIRFR